MELDLKQQVMVNQFVNTTGLAPPAAQQLLIVSKWNMDIAMSNFYQQISVVQPQQQRLGIAIPQTPANTPVTPPMFPEAFLAMQNFKVSGSGDQ